MQQTETEKLVRENSQRIKHVNLSVTRWGMTGSVVPHSMVVEKIGVVHFKYCWLCKSPHFESGQVMASPKVTGYLQGSGLCLQP